MQITQQKVVKKRSGKILQEDIKDSIKELYDYSLAIALWYYGVHRAMRTMRIGHCTQGENANNRF
jgi:hypothetical protein